MNVFSHPVFMDYWYLWGMGIYFILFWLIAGSITYMEKGEPNGDMLGLAFISMFIWPLPTVLALGFALCIAIYMAPVFLVDLFVKKPRPET